MSLKVLLADDSAAIKKVVQLSLQDYGVELKSVGSGKDVLDVARSFKPDIAFVDVLLPHKTGYEIASEIKKDAQLKETPVVMLWSSFMSFDEGKYKSSGANDKLEKPFEVAGLRSLVNRLVPKTQNSPLNRHLEFPKLEFDMAQGGIPKAAPVDSTEGPTQPSFQIPPELSQKSAEESPAESNWSMSSFEEMPAPSPVESSVDLSGATTVMPEPAAAESTGESIWGGDNEWVRKDLGKFKVPIPDDTGSDEGVSFTSNESQLTDTSFLLKPESKSSTPAEQSPAAPQGIPKPEVSAKAKAAAAAGAPVTPSVHAEATPLLKPLNEGMSDELREQTRDIIERVVWKLVPEIAENIIKQEIQRLLSEEK